MIHSIKAVNFQSLHDVELEFGKFTVIEGASSSGKSAIRRALEAVTSNALDTSYITQGQKSASVTIGVENTKVTIERESGGSSVYKIAKSGNEESRYSKLNRQVPPQVTEVLGISPSTQEVASINFAGQFDAPYLLKETGSSVAKILGELTNVSKIFAAVKEANRRIKNASGTANLRKKDLESVKAGLSRFSDIKQVASDLRSAEQIIEQAAAAQAELTQFQDLCATLDRAVKDLESFVEVPELPDLGEVLGLHESFQSFTGLLKQLSLNQKIINDCANQLQGSRSQIDDAEKSLHDLLIQEGTCPTCNQVVMR